MINAPVLHVNGDYPEGASLRFVFCLIQLSTRCLVDVARAMNIAFKYRNYFRKDVIIDLIVYRRWYVGDIMCCTWNSFVHIGDITNSTSPRLPNR